MEWHEMQDAKYHQMTETPIPGLIARLAVPTICSMLITSIYNMADTYFVSQLGTDASAAVGVIFSLMALIQAVGFTFGIGSSTCVSRLLGQRKQQAACESLSTAFFTSIAFGTLMLIFGLLFLEKLVSALGATPEILPYARDYARYILIGAPYMTANFVLNTSLRGQGSAFYAMFGIMSGGILNIVLDPIFIFGFGMGIRGAAIATVLSQLVSFGILLYFNLGERHGSLPLRLKNYRFRFSLYRDIVKGGLPSLCRQGIASIASVALVRSCAPFGVEAISAMSIVNRVMLFIVSAMIGFGQGFQPVCGFNYGARRYDRVIESFWFCVKVSALLLTTLGAVMFLIAPQVLALFREGDARVISIGAAALRMQCAMLPAQSYFIMSNMMLQCTGRSAPATLLAAGRQGLFFLPVVCILPHVIGLPGVLLSQPISDVFFVLLAVLLSRRFLRELKLLDADQREEQARWGEVEG